MLLPEHRGVQRTAREAGAMVALLILILLLPLLFFPAQRLSLAQHFGWVAGADAAKLYDGSDAVELLILTETVPNPGSLPSHRYRAHFIAERTDEEVLLHDLDTTEESMRLPIRRFDLIAAGNDGSLLLFVNEETGGPPEAVLVSPTAETVKRLPPGETAPELPGDWETDLATLAQIDCASVSPNGRWIACLRHGDSGSPYLFGDWELQVAPFGRSGDGEAIYRGRGADPIVGWSADETAIYFQNDTGLWRVPVDPSDRAAR